MYTNGEKLDGEWNGSAYPEYGIYTYANGDRYGGSWKQGKKHGIGTYYFVNGAKYQGEYKDGEPNGIAAFVEADGKAYEEVWTSGKRTKRTLITTVKFTAPRSGQGAAPAAASSSSSVAPAAPVAAPSPGGGDQGAAAAAAEDLVLGLNAATLVNGPEVERHAPRLSSSKPRPSAVAVGGAPRSSSEDPTVVRGGMLLID